jgi:hypothetical protein
VFLALSTIAITFLQSCHDECDDARRVSAEFKVYNELYYFDKENGKSVQKIKIIEEDTFMVPSYVTFEALDPNAQSYEWRIGSDPRKRTGSKVTLLFQDAAVISENPLPVTLKMKKIPNSKCLPNDPGVDSVTTFIYFLDFDEWPLLGKYRGVDDTDPSKTFVIEIYRDSKTGVAYVTNLPNECNPNNPGISIEGATAFEFALYNFPAPLNYFPPLVMNCFVQEHYKKIGWLSTDRKSITIDYEFTEGGLDESKRKHRIFKGTRI